ncbi:peptidoglycan-binding protein [Diaphorobacter aerolatus]|uniref:Peptidoglycan-binding protein n=1 Tax=Diaphorobacter aerolatus TaxID=1288495 RepID=A0A7H0GP51_9BURK|nr:peptidoglycan-binding protein [Diaphorobacter aerolatus]QNP50067.1 peptidoglycan-binding protein [Diaphorobacter aerolatus]
MNAVLVALNEEDAWLEGANGSQTMIPVSELASLWHGEITTLWRAPKVLAEGADPATQPEAQEWLDEQLSNWPGAKAKPTSGRPTAVRRERIRQFQLAQGITPDGQAGPLTLMLLNRAAGVAEPRLRTGA